MLKVKVLVAQSHQTLCNPRDCSPPGSSVRGILQATLEWVATSFSRGSFQPRDRTALFDQLQLHCRQVLYYLSHQGSLRRTLNYALLQSAFPGKKCRWGQWQGVDSWNWLRTTVLFPNFYFKNSSREPIEKVYLSVRSTQTQKSHSPCQSWPHAIHFSESSTPSRVAWPGHHICGQN